MVQERGGGVSLTAHSVVRDQNGALFDITPLANESRPEGRRTRSGMRFVEHEGDPSVFDQMKAERINIHCCDFSAMEPVEEPLQESFGETGEEE